MRRGERPECHETLLYMSCAADFLPDGPVLSSACFWHGYRCPKPAHEVSDEWVTTPPRSE